VTGYAQVTMTIYNNSSETIDSVVIDGTKPFMIGPISKSSKKTFFVSVDQANFHSFAPFYIRVYSAALNTKIQWYKTGFIDTIYFFNHGLSLYNHELLRPETFELYIFNATLEKIDVAPNNAILKVIELTPRSFAVTLDHQKVEAEQTISFKVGQKVFTPNLRACNFDDWNVTRGSLYVDQDTVFVGLGKNTTPFEFVIDFEIQERLSPKDIQLKAEHLLKTYVNNERNSIRAVFDYTLFKPNPKFQIKVGRKMHVIELKKKDVEETDYQQFYISKKQVRRA
jgi:hypothetical protein